MKTQIKLFFEKAWLIASYVMVALLVTAMVALVASAVAVIIYCMIKALGSIIVF